MEIGCNYGYAWPLGGWVKTSCTQRFKTLLIATGLVLATACSSDSGDVDDPLISDSVPAAIAPRTILFVGNSFSTVEGNIDRHFKSLAASTQKPKSVDTALASRGGATLATLSQDAGIMQSVRSGAYELIVLQDDIPEYGPPSTEPFKSQVRSFNRDIQSRGGRTALFMTWAYGRLNWISMATIAAAHKEVGVELGVPVAPVGLAFDASRAARPGLAMLGTDQEHETLQGVYLAACVIYGTLFQETPEGATYVPPGMTLDQAAFLQEIAWKSVNGWSAGLRNP